MTGLPSRSTGESALQIRPRRLHRLPDTLELTDYLGYERGDPAGRCSGNSRNGSTSKRVQTDIGRGELDVPRDRNGEFDPKIVPKHAAGSRGATSASSRSMAGG